MSRNQPDYYMPSDFFSRQTLEKTILILKKEHPALSQCVQGAMENLPVVPFEKLHRAYTSEMIFNYELVGYMKAHVIGRVVSCLTEIGQKVLSNKQTAQMEMINLRSIIEDWMLLTEWILLRSDSDVKDCTSYQ
jgi:hypothetical protein